MVTETIIGISLFSFFAVSLTASIAAFNCSTSCAVSRSIISTPPSINPLAASVYPLYISSKEICPRLGSFTPGPKLPAIKISLFKSPLESGFFKYSSLASFAINAALLASS